MRQGEIGTKGDPGANGRTGPKGDEGPPGPVSFSNGTVVVIKVFDSVILYLSLNYLKL